MNPKRFSDSLLCACAAFLIARACAGADALPVMKYVGVYHEPPATVGELDPAIKAYRIPDGPLMGNGDLAVAVGGTFTNQTFYLSKSDLSQGARGLGSLTFSFQEKSGDTSKYRQEQDLYKAEVRSVIPLRQASVFMRSWTADTDNTLITDLWTDGTEALDVELRLWAHADRSATQAGSGHGMIWATRKIVGTVGATKQPFRS